MPLSVIPGLEPKHLKRSVYGYITNELGLEIKSSHIWIKVMWQMTSMRKFFL